MKKRGGPFLQLINVFPTVGGRGRDVKLLIRPGILRKRGKWKGGKKRGTFSRCAGKHKKAFISSP